MLDRLAEYHITLNRTSVSLPGRQLIFWVTTCHPRVYSNVKTIEETSRPTSAKEVASFLGTTNFHLKFVRHYADTAETLRRLLRKDIPWEWTDEKDQAFRTPKHKITSALMFAHFDPGAQTILTTDASGNGFRAVLSLMSGGKERPVAYALKMLSATEWKYSTGKREALACIFACEHWLVFLFGRKFTLRTDHQALIYRWSDRLHHYDFDIQYIAGSKNQIF